MSLPATPSWPVAARLSADEAKELPVILSASNLRETAAWIRDVLDPLVAREGPVELHPDDVLTLHTILLNLQKWPVSRWTLRYSRIGLAILLICGKCTRWPAKLADEADKYEHYAELCRLKEYLGADKIQSCVEHLECIFGPLTELAIPLYEKGGRLYTVCDPEDITRESLVKKFASRSPSYVDNSRAYFHGDLDFKPGQWWINGMFAFRDGIIDDRCTDGGICYNSTGAYAILMTDFDEICDSTPDRFTYVCNNSDRGRFRLTAGDFKSRHTIRILRSHAMKSLWSPRVGLRYEGLYRITGWKCNPIKPELNDGVPLQYLVHFERDDPSPTADIFTHPNAEDFDDYRRYKESIREQRDAEKAGAELLSSGHSSAEYYIARMKTMEDRDVRLQSKAANYMYKNGAIDVSPGDQVTSNVLPEGKGDGMGQAFQRGITVMSTRTKNASQSHSYDGSVDETKEGIDGRLQEGSSSEMAANPSSVMIQHKQRPHDLLPERRDTREDYQMRPNTTMNLAVPLPWRELFAEIDWKSRKSVNQSRKLIDQSKTTGSIDPSAATPYTTAEARGAFEIARARKPLPANAPAFLEALSRVFDEIATPDYVTKRVVKEIDL